MLIVDTTLSLELRNKLGIRGVLPPAVDTPEIQIERCLARIRAKTTNLDKYFSLFSILIQVRVSRKSSLYKCASLLQIAHGTHSSIPER
jgi:hypothetical protein